MITEEDKDKLIATLTLQLQEKDIEIENLKEENERNKAEVESQHKSFIDCFKDKMGLTLYYANMEEKHNQDKISFAVAKLEELKKDIYKYCNDESACEDMPLHNLDTVEIEFIINNQIKQLKEGR